MALTAANVLLALAVVGGNVLALWHIRAAGPEQRPPLALGLAHRAMAAGLLGMVVLLGMAVLVRRRVAGVLIVLHAGVAICGWVLFLAWSSLG